MITRQTTINSSNEQLQEFFGLRMILENINVMILSSFHRFFMAVERTNCITSDKIYHQTNKQ